MKEQATKAAARVSVGGIGEIARQGVERALAAFRTRRAKRRLQGRGDRGEGNPRPRRGAASLVDAAWMRHPREGQGGLNEPARSRRDRFRGSHRHLRNQSLRSIASAQMG